MMIVLKLNSDAHMEGTNQTQRRKILNHCEVSPEMESSYRAVAKNSGAFIMQLALHEQMTYPHCKFHKGVHKHVANMV